MDQPFPDTGIREICGEVRRLLEGFDLKQGPKTGQSVAVCVASRGTHDLKDLVKTTVTHLVNSGLKPFITPAMGSHGAATGEGQAMVLRGLGITEAFTGVPIRATMEVASLGRVDEGPEIFTAVDALEADHIVSNQPGQTPHGFPLRRGIGPLQDPGDRPGTPSGRCQHAQV